MLSDLSVQAGSLCYLVYRLAYNGDVAAGQLAVFQGASEAPISGSIRAEPPRRRKNSQPAAARRVALKMGRLGKRIGVSACRRVGVCKASSTRPDPLVIIAVSQSSLS